MRFCLWCLAPAPVVAETNVVVVQDGEHSTADELVTLCEESSRARARWSPFMHTPQDDAKAALSDEVGAATHVEADMTDEMRYVLQAALDAYKEKEGTAATDAQRAFLTSTTLKHYVDPPKVTHLRNALLRREKVKETLRGEDVYLAGSLRVVGWDGDGSSILSWETQTQRAAFASYIPQFEYMLWTAFDLNRPGADGAIVISSYTAGYFNPMYFMNPKPVIALAEMLEGQYRRRLKAAIMVGMPRAFEWILSLLLKAVKEETRKKLVICRTEDEANAHPFRFHYFPSPPVPVAFRRSSHATRISA